MNMIFSMHKRSTLLSLLLLTASLLAGCNSAPTRDLKFSAVRPPMPDSGPARTNGAILSLPNQGQQFYSVQLFTDNRARNVGDILTVKLLENTSAEKESETVVGQETDFSVTNPSVFGVSPSIKLPTIAKYLTDKIITDPAGGRYDLSADIGSAKDFDGKGESIQSNSLTGEITVSVSEVLANGYLLVRGEKLYTLNRGHEHIRFSGIVRPMDIASDNSVESTRVANARIVYSGEGEVAGASAPGWLTRFFVGDWFPL